MSERELGTFFKQFRTERGISLKAASGGKESALSRMENGHTNMTNQRMYQVMVNLGMEFDDLMTLGYGFELQFNVLAESLWRKRYALTMNRPEDFNLTTINCRNVAFKVVINNIETSVSQKRAVMLGEKQTDIITGYLSRKTDWILSDYWLFILSISRMKLNAVINMTRIVKEQLANLADKSGYWNMANLATLELALSLYLKDSPQLEKTIIADLRTATTDLYSLNDGMLSNFLTAIADADTEQDAEKLCNEYRNAALAIDDSQLERYITNVYRRTDEVIL